MLSFSPTLSNRISPRDPADQLLAFSPSVAPDILVPAPLSRLLPVGSSRADAHHDSDTRKRAARPELARPERPEKDGPTVRGPTRATREGAALLSHWGEYFFFPFNIGPAEL